MGAPRGSRTPRRRLASAFLLGVCFSSAQVAAAAKGHDIRPVPAWVAAVTVPDGALGASPDERADVQQLLVDEQDRFTDTGVENYRHYARHISSTQGVHNASEIVVEYDPGFRTLHLHYVRIVRGNVTSDALSRSDVRVVSAQTDPEARIYDDTVGVHVLLGDVRVGDTIEYAYTITGQNPTLRGHVLADMQLARPWPIRKLEQRVSFPDSASVASRVFGAETAPARTSAEGFTQLAWSATNVDNVEVEDETPAWFQPYPSVQISDFATWADVARWAAELYDKPPELSAEVDAMVERWRSEPPETRLVHAIRFVQDEVRYLGLEIGPNTFEPHPPAQVVAQRFGDCKDKSLLLVTLLRKLGIDAVPALVSSDGGPSVSEKLPSPYAFDHVVVRAVLGAKTLFFDPTITYQRGSTDELRAPDYGHALPVSRDTTALETLARPQLDLPLSETIETLHLTGSDLVARFDVETSFRGDQAEAQRSLFASTGLGRLQRRYENFYARSFPVVTASSPLQSTDDEATGTFKVTEHYRLDDFWDEDGTRKLRAASVQAHLSMPDIVKRTQPLSVQHPLFVRHTIIVNWDDTTDFAIDPLELKGDALAFRRYGSASAGQLRLTYELRSFKDHVTPPEAPAHLKLVNRILDETVYELQRDAPSTSTVTPIPAGARLGGIVLAVTVLGASAVVFAVSRRQRRRIAPLAPRGETAATAEQLDSKSAARASMAALRCRCGERPGAEASEDAGCIRFGDDLLTVMVIRCRHCGTKTTRYFKVPPER